MSWTNGCDCQFLHCLRIIHVIIVDRTRQFVACACKTASRIYLQGFAVQHQLVHRQLQNLWLKAVVSAPLPTLYLLLTQLPSHNILLHFSGLPKGKKTINDWYIFHLDQNFWLSLLLSLEQKNHCRNYYLLLLRLRLQLRLRLLLSTPTTPTTLSLPYSRYYLLPITLLYSLIVTLPDSTCGPTTYLLPLSSLASPITFCLP